MLFFVAAKITFKLMKIEKDNVFFAAVLYQARSIKAKNKIKMYLYRFLAGMRAILRRDPHGVFHFKYIEKRHARQLAFSTLFRSERSRA